MARYFLPNHFGARPVPRRRIHHSEPSPSSCHQLARAHGSQPAYGFFFTRRHPYTAGITFADHDPATVGVYHTGDVPYWLSSLDALNMFRTTRDWSPMDRQLAVTMSGMVVRFAHGEKPAANWPAFDPRAPKSMQLGEEVKVIGWPNAKALPLLVDAAPPAPAPAATPRVRD